LLVYGIYLHRIGGIELSLSPGLFPSILGIVLIVLGRDVILRASRKGFPLLLSTMIIGYSGLWYILGAHLSTFSFAGLGLYFLKEESLYRSILFGLLLTICIDLLFVRFFGIQLN
ncbi:MAG: hypothetical protein GX046_00480, partial [Tissierellia bacterium]|nr:hypothetical protein [Tissierellia bacterium]